MLLMYNYVLLKMSTWYSKHVGESNNIWRINNIQCITLVVLYSQSYRFPTFESTSALRIGGCMIMKPSLKFSISFLVFLYHLKRYHMLLMYNYVLLKMSTWYSKHVGESNNIWRINNIQCITLVVLCRQSYRFPTFESTSALRIGGCMIMKPSLKLSISFWYSFIISNWTFVMPIFFY